jgi:hypothetical protein
MDREATTKGEFGTAVGLADYGRHARSDLLTHTKNELAWVRRLRELLTRDGLVAETEFTYPMTAQISQRKRRDLHVLLPNNKSMSIEVKGGWSDYWGRQSKIYRSYLFRPLVPGLDPRKTHTVPFDLERLSTLRPPAADYVGQLLVGFERPDDSMVPDVEVLIELAGLDAWRCATDSWMSPTIAGQRVRCWFWYRPADGKWRLPTPAYD